MAKLEPIVLQLKADIRDLSVKLEQAQRLSDQRLGNIERRATQVSSALSTAGTAVKTFAASLLTIQSVQALAKLADTAKGIEAQLRLATRESGNFAQAQEDVRRIAATTRTELESTAQLYGNFQRNARELGISQDEAARATETTAKAFKISGATTIEASQATRQLVQALQSGVLRGDEFNTIMEAGPRLSKLLADSLGVTTGALRKMAEEGELTSAKLVRALTDKKFTTGIDEEFRSLPKTFGEAMTQIENAAIVTFGAFDRGGQFSTALANFVTDGAGGFSKLETAAEQFGSTVSGEIAGIVNAFQQVKDLIDSISNTMAGDWAGDLINQVGTYAQLANPTNFSIRAIRTATEPARQSKLRENNARIQNDRVNKLLNFDPRFPLGRPEQPAIKPAATSAKKKPKGRKGPSAEQIAARQEAEGLRLAQDELRARYDLTTDVVERADIAKQILGSEREEMLARLRAQKILTPALQKQIDELYGQPAKVDPVTGETKIEGRPGLLAQQINRDLEEQQQRMANDMLSRQADTLDALAEIETNTQSRNKLELSALNIQQSIQRNLLEQEIATGKIAEADAQRARDALEAQQTASRIRLQRSQMTPGQRYVFDLGTAADNINEAIEDIQVQGLESLNDGLADAILGVRSLGDVFHSVAGQIISDLLRIAIQKSITTPLANALFSGGLKIGGNTAGLEANFDRVLGRASGGRVTGGQLYRVNEGSGRRVEGFIPQGSGEIVPLGRMNSSISAPQSGGGQTTVRVELSQDLDARIVSRSSEVAVEVVRGASPAIIDASAREAGARLRRPKL